MHFPFAHNQRGSVFPMMLLALTGLLLAGMFTVESITLNSDTSQLKHGLDAAAMALGRSYPTLKNDPAGLQAMAEQYVHANLGVNSQVPGNLDGITVTSGSSSLGYATYTVTATLRHVPMLLAGSNQSISLHSTAEIRQVSTEVALAIPNTLLEDSRNLAVLRTLGNYFAEQLIGDSDNTWLSLVPYSQAVSVYDATQANRLRLWAKGNTALRPVELTSLFNSGYASLADGRIPDRAAKLLCMYRGLNRGDNYFWDKAPAGQFLVYYRADLPENGSPGAAPVSWEGPNPEFGKATGVNDTRWLVADHGCPQAAVLPLTNDFSKISSRLNQMDTRFNVNYAIAMGWAAMTLAPTFRGSSGWALEDDLPKDFDDGSDERIKAVVLLANTSKTDWFDSDSYNAYVGQAVDGTQDGNTNGDALITQRFADLCSSFKAHRLKFYLIATGIDESGTDNLNDESASTFRRVAGKGLAGCVDKSADLTYLNGADFVASQGAIESRLDAIVKELQQQRNFVHLIE
ncbi:hypothetical protein ALP05_03216 [Pseudomonas caricapapayae]|uniref:Uncharacterized protein n=1 Tax=Pseudomonas caricapapayae TaxID=46678 RepID=A0A3M6EWY2_9PSED|nr:pilus assembly protein [Pseudomonas caricapapayae]RMV72788.1 hypothetical protein ALP05_03216 [Pseudomonas caricapapayae]